MNINFNPHGDGTPDWPRGALRDQHESRPGLPHTEPRNITIYLTQSSWLYISLFLSMALCISPCLSAHLSPLLVGVEVGVAAPDHPLRVALGLHVAVRRRPGQAGRGECVLTSEQASAESSDHGSKQRVYLERPGRLSAGGGRQLLREGCAATNQDSQHLKSLI